MSVVGLLETKLRKTRMFSDIELALICEHENCDPVKAAMERFFNAVSYGSAKTLVKVVNALLTTHDANKHLRDEGYSVIFIHGEDTYCIYDLGKHKSKTDTGICEIEEKSLEEVDKVYVDANLFGIVVNMLAKKKQITIGEVLDQSATLICNYKGPDTPIRSADIIEADISYNLELL